MRTPFTSPTRPSDTLLAVASALVIAGILFATAIIPDTPANAGPLQIVGHLA
jgi:hypothetical protein